MKRDKNLELISELVVLKRFEKEVDDEGGMAMNQLQTIIDAVEILKNHIKNPNDQLPAWVQSKITLAENHLTTVAEYIKSGVKVGDPELSGIENDEW